MNANAKHALNVSQLIRPVGGAAATLALASAHGFDFAFALGGAFFPHMASKSHLSAVMGCNYGWNKRLRVSVDMQLADDEQN